jgi:hypothetical protein
MKEFHEVKKNTLMYYSYYLTGGIFSSDQFSIREKCGWFGFCFVSVLFVLLISAGGYLVTAESLNGFEVVLVLGVTCSYCVFIIGILLLIQIHRRDFKNLFYFIENHRLSRNNRPLKLERDVESESDVGLRLFGHLRGDSMAGVQDGLFWFKLIFCIVQMNTVAIVVDVSFFCPKSSPFRDLQHHLIPVPYLHRIPTLEMFLILLTCENLLFMLLGIFPGFPNALMVTIGVELRNIVVAYCERMQMFTQYFVFCTRTEGDFKQRRQLSYMFERNLIIFIRDYRELLR